MHLIKKINLNKIRKIVVKFLIYFHKDYNRYKFKSVIIYILYFLNDLYINYNRKYSINKINDYYLLKYSYIIYLINLYKKIFFIFRYSSSLKYYLIYLENENNKISFINIKNNYFSYNYDSIIFYSFYYKFKINLWSFILYGKYIEYMTAYLYNLYLSTKCLLFRYPLINVILRYILRDRLSKLVHFKKYKFSKLSFLHKYHIYDMHIISYKNLNVVKSYNIYKTFIKSKIIKLFNILSNRNIYIYISYLLDSYSKVNFLYNIYFINIFNDPDNCLACEYNKFNIQGIFSLYWQLSRYGFNIDHSYNCFNVFNVINNYYKIKFYNNNYYKNILFYNKSNNIFWYKIKNIVILNYIKRSFFKFAKYNKLNLKKKFNKRKIIRKWCLFIQIYNMIFYPLNLNFYYDIKNLNNYILKFKLKLDYLFGVEVFIFKYKKFQRYYINYINIINAISLDNKISYNYINNKNLALGLLLKKINKYYYMNLLALFSTLENICINNNNFDFNILFFFDINFKKLYESNLNLLYFDKLRSLEKFTNFYILYEYKYTWVFEKSLIFNMYVKYMFHLYMFMFIYFFSYMNLNIAVINKVKLNQIKSKNKKNCI